MSFRRLICSAIKAILILSLLLGCRPKATNQATKVPSPVTQTAAATMTPVKTQVQPQLQQGKLVFYILEGEKANVYTANLDGSGLISLTDQTGRLNNPIWSPDGKSIAYTSTEKAFVMNADGTGVHPIPGSGPLDIVSDWSPDGRFLLVDLTGM